MTLYITIGNTDNKLDQQTWHTFTQHLYKLMLLHCHTIHGEFYTQSNTPYQTCCMSGELYNEYNSGDVEKAVSELAKNFNQDSIAMSIANTKLVKSQ